MKNDKIMIAQEHSVDFGRKRTVVKINVSI